MNPFPYCAAHELAISPPEHRWLIEWLWGAEAVGLVGAEPKSYKSLTTLQMAVAVASGRPFLDSFPVHRSGKVLLFAAEDALPMVRNRLEGLCLHQGLLLADLPLYVITADRIRLDLPQDYERLANTVEQVKPVLLILDPFVRLHLVDENVAAAVVPLLAGLRTIQRHNGCAIVVVHHAKKGASKLRAGQALRGTSEFHAWSDSSLFLRRQGDLLRMWVEHRALPSREPLDLRLHVQNDVASLRLCTESSPVPLEAQLATNQKLPPIERVMGILENSLSPIMGREIRRQAGLRSETLGAVLKDLTEQGRIVKTSSGFSKTSPAGIVTIAQPLPQPPDTLPIAERQQERNLLNQEGRTLLPLTLPSKRPSTLTLPFPRHP